MAERKKPLHVDNPEKLINLLTRLMEDLSSRGFDITGLLQHISYISWMASTGIYAVEALVEYDFDMRDRAREHGCGAFCGGDTHLSNMYLGASGTKAYRSTKGQSRGASGGPGGPGGQGGSGGGGRVNSGGNRRQGFTGWRKTAANLNICFEHAQGRQCGGCRFKHECTCGSKDHGMLNCPNQNRRDGGSGNA